MKQPKSKLAILALAALMFAASAIAQAPRPPIQKLSSLTGDVSITSPVDNQPLVYNASLGKWDNSNTLADILLTSTTDGGMVANKDLGLTWTLSGNNRHTARPNPRRHN